jgi:hypothetical protein
LSSSKRQFRDLLNGDFRIDRWPQVQENLAIAEFQDEEKMGRFCSLPKEGAGILLMMTTEFAPESHVKVVLENLTFALMQSARRELGWCQLS